MMAGPTSPGVTSPVYHPAGKPLGGTCKVLSALSLRVIRAVSTPITGICSRTGTDRARCETSAPVAMPAPGGRFAPMVAPATVAVAGDRGAGARPGAEQPATSATNNAATTPTTQRGQRRL